MNLKDKVKSVFKNRKTANKKEDTIHPSPSAKVKEETEPAQTSEPDMNVVIDHFTTVDAPLDKELVFLHKLLQPGILDAIGYEIVCTLIKVDKALLDDPSNCPLRTQRKYFNIKLNEMFGKYQ